MVTVEKIDKRIELENLEKQFAQCASNPPGTDPFTREGSQAWMDWTETCRGFEAELQGMGISL